MTTSVTFIDRAIAELVALRAEMTGAAAARAAWEKHVAHRNPDGKLTVDELRDRLAVMEPREHEHLLYHINGYCPAALLSALESEEQARLPREPAPPAAGPGGVLFAIPEAVVTAGPPHHAVGERPCRAWDSKSSWICTAQDGHDGPDHIAYKVSGGEYHRWAAVPATDDEPEDHPDTAGPTYGEAELRRADARERSEGDADLAAMSGYCPATTGPDKELEQVLYCDREAGHAGSHHAPGPDEGSEVAWSDEPASVTA